MKRIKQVTRVALPATLPHRRTSADLCSRCATPFPCTSVVEGYDTDPGSTARRYSEESVAGAVLVLVLEGSVQDSGQRELGEDGRSHIEWQVARLDSWTDLTHGE